MKKILLPTVLSTILLAHASAAETFNASISFDTPYPVYLDDSVTVYSNIQFDTSFSSISRMCFEAAFETDLLDTDETFMIGPFHTTPSSSSSFGFKNIFSTPIEKRKSCITAAHKETAFFLDGFERVGITVNGSAMLSDFIVTLEGEADTPIIVPEEPTHTVELEPVDGASNIPAEGGIVKYSAVIENSDFDYAYKSLYRWSVLTLPTGDDYSIHKSRAFDIDAGLSREFNRRKLTIPAWFPAGEYTYTWYVADPQASENSIQSASFTFEKVE